MSAQSTYVAIISDGPILLRGLSHVLDTAPDLERVASVGNSDPRRAECPADADVVLLHTQAPVRDACKLVTELHERGHKVVVLSASAAQTEELLLFIEAGARGYLSQHVGEAELLTAIRAVASGRSHFSTVLDDRTPHKRGLRITDRERQILELVASGATDREIASKLNISEHTVHSHLDRLGSKTGFRRRADLTRLALLQGAAGELAGEG
ncbi:DNA-binding response regulator [Streptomyces hygroscopicus subsp. hygroscopicus]|uniref:response regulator transcription factor n=1 Tax=Streptomyces sp. KHY 26 TaxID=3097359 RepID=UPI0024A51480|nr:response regulator transcription factor [Streptomyces hygroscopicus]GLX52351.1 DNA-binding response regulator [Streptomyces hygroscopicus subsp. hygroscopicus]